MLADSNILGTSMKTSNLDRIRSLSNACYFFDDSIALYHYLCLVFISGPFFPFFRNETSTVNVMFQFSVSAEFNSFYISLFLYRLKCPLLNENSLQVPARNERKKKGEIAFISKFLLLFYTSSKTRLIVY
jgi:hypothetical protein